MSFRSTAHRRYRNPNRNPDSHKPVHCRPAPPWEQPHKAGRFCLHIPGSEGKIKPPIGRAEFGVFLQYYPKVITVGEYKTQRRGGEWNNQIDPMIRKLLAV